MGFLTWNLCKHPFLFAGFLLFVTTSLSQAQADVSSPDALAGRKDQAEILQEADDIFAEVSRLSGLPIKKQVDKKFENLVFFHDYYLQLLQNQYPPETKVAYEKAFALFGFLPLGKDLIQTYLDSFLKVVQGLYDPKSKTLYIADWIKPEDQESALAHELTHALQDQSFDLQAFMDQGVKLSMDAQFARAAVMEGQAVAIALNYSLKDRNTDFTHAVDIAQWVGLNNLLDRSGKKAFGEKATLNETVSFPYVYGVTFLQSYVRSYGWEGMESLFRKPPSSTHQILHPRTFFPIRQEPVGIHVDDLSQEVLPGYKRIWDNCFGEYGLITLLQQFIPGKEAEKAVRGWRGDRIQVYENQKSKHLLMTGYLLFDQDDSAEDFFDAYRDYLDSKYEADIFRRSDDTIQWVSLKGGDREVYVERFGRRVVVIEGSDSGTTASLRGELWDVKSNKPAIRPAGGP